MKADRDKITRLLKTARGQMDGILKMVEEDRYCVDISNQLLATESILRKANMSHCVKDAFETGDAEEKVDEIIAILDKMSK